MYIGLLFSILQPLVHFQKQSIQLDILSAIFLLTLHTCMYIERVNHLKVPPIARGSKTVAIFQKHVRVTNHEFKCKRNFNFSLYGNQALTLVAVTKFEEEVKAIMREFDKYSRKPTQRQKLLEAHGVDASAFKKSVSFQGERLLRRLFLGCSNPVEDTIIKHLWQNVHEPTLLKVSSLKREGSGFCATFQGSKQKMEQSFKTVKAASDWLVQLYTANKDRMCLWKIMYLL